jgi:methylated-DNA-[protein]-cysteine S-methyltransferase
VPRGEVVTYGELAALAGRPGAARAAGTFCARNRLAPFVPCHRVVAAGGVGSYGSLGLDYKRRLLALEGVTL